MTKTSTLIMRVFHAFAIGVTGAELCLMILANYHRWEAIILFPQNLIKGMGLLALSLTFMSGIGFVSTFFQIPTWRSIHVSYTVGMALVCVFHLALIFLSHDYALNLHEMLMVVWANSSGEYRSFVQDKVRKLLQTLYLICDVECSEFECCGYTGNADHAMKPCPNELYSTPCDSPLVNHVQGQLDVIIIILLAMLCIEWWAFNYGIVYLCHYSPFISKSIPKSRNRQVLEGQQHIV